jgi:pimeloyl-ACP methyl ester carboxylesterase
MADFILVHGAMHGAWCWELVRNELQQLGHRAFAMDLPVDNLDARIPDYADAVVRATDGIAGERALVVGHSLSGLVIPHVARRRPVEALIYLCALVAPVTAADQKANLELFHPALLAHRRLDEFGRIFYTDEAAIDVFYHDVAPPLQQWAVSNLRPQVPQLNTELLPEMPGVPAYAIIAAEDRIAVSAERHRELMRTRLGIEPLEIGGGHSPFLARPAELALMLHRISLQTSATDA